jgi:TPR repeat protein
VRTPLSDKKQFAIRVNPAKTELAAPAAAQPVAPAPIPPQAQPEIAAPQHPQPEPTAVPETPKPAKPAPSFFSTETVPAATSGIAPQAELRGKPASSAGAAQQTAASRQAALQAPSTLADPAKGAPRTEIEDLIRDGNKRMKEGDILEARRLYQKAFALGDPEAALAMGRSYDPIYFARIDKKNAEPDAAKAFDWYRKAMDGGASQTAKVRIENLKHFLNQ